MQMTHEEKLKDTVYFIEANGNEVMTVWRTFKDKIKLEQDNSGFSVIIG